MSETGKLFDGSVTLDALFRRNAANNPRGIAITESGLHLHNAALAPLTYAELDAAITNVAAQLRALSLPPRSTIALQLPNGSEFIIALLAVLRAGCLALPVPVLWRKSDLVRALRHAEASALVTTANFSAESLPMLAVEAATDVFELSFPCAFGDNLPDGILRLSVSGAANEPFDVRTIDASAAGIATLAPAAGGVELIARNDGEWLAAGLGALIASDMRAGDATIAAVSLSSAAGIAGAFVPWLLSGGTLHLCTDLPDTSTIGPDARVHVVTPARALDAICSSLRVPVVSATAVHYDGGAEAFDFQSIHAERVVDLHALGEAAVVALRRTARQTPAPIPLGLVYAGSAAADAPAVVETKLDSDMRLFVRGPMVPGTEGGWQATGFGGVALSRNSFALETPDDMIAIGSLRFNMADLEQRVLAASPGVRIAMIGDPILGTRLVIWAEDPGHASRALLEAGLPRIIANAVLQAERTRATG